MAETEAIIRQIIIMLLLISVGMICCKAHIITPKVNQKLSVLVLNVINPALILTSYQVKFQMRELQGLSIAFGMAMVSMVFSTLLAQFVVRGRHTGSCDTPVERFSIVYSNCGFMGIPLISGFLGSKGVFYLTAYLTAFNLLVWTHGVMLMKGGRSLKQIGRIVRTPALLATALGLLLFVFQIRIPSVLLCALNDLSAMNTPMAMLVAGSAIAQTSLFHALAKPRIYYISLLRLLAVPAATMAFFLPFSPDHTVFLTVLIASACPAGTMSTLFALMYKKNAAYASEIFAFSTLLSVATLPAVTFLSHVL